MEMEMEVKRRSSLFRGDFGRPKKRTRVLAILCIALLFLPLLSGCSSGDDVTRNKEVLSRNNSEYPPDPDYDSLPDYDPIMDPREGEGNGIRDIDPQHVSEAIDHIQAAIPGLISENEQNPIVLALQAGTTPQINISAAEIINLVGIASSDPTPAPNPNQDLFNCVKDGLEIYFGGISLIIDVLFNINTSFGMTASIEETKKLVEILEATQVFLSFIMDLANSEATNAKKTKSFLKATFKIIRTASSRRLIIILFAENLLDLNPSDSWQEMIKPLVKFVAQVVAWEAKAAVSGIMYVAKVISNIILELYSASELLEAIENLPKDCSALHEHVECMTLPFAVAAAEEHNPSERWRATKYGDHAWLNRTQCHIQVTDTNGMPPFEICGFVDKDWHHYSYYHNKHWWTERSCHNLSQKDRDDFNAVYNQQQTFNSEGTYGYLMYYPDCDGDTLFSEVGVAALGPADANFIFDCRDGENPNGGWSLEQGADPDDEALPTNPEEDDSCIQFDLCEEPDPPGPPDPDDEPPSPNPDDNDDCGHFGFDCD